MTGTTVQSGSMGSKVVRNHGNGRGEDAGVRTGGQRWLGEVHHTAQEVLNGIKPSTFMSMSMVPDSTSWHTNSKLMQAWQAHRGC